MAALVLEAGLCLLIVLAPLPFGAVGPAGRLALETGAFLLTAVWTWEAARERVALPPRAVLVGVFGLLALAAIQIVPLGAGAVAAIAPWTAALRAAVDDSRLSPTLSIAPDATASALRTGAALAGILLVATTVAARRGAHRLAGAMLVSAAFQGLYGLVVLASGSARIWNVPKVAYLDSATGTFVNRNHFAGFLAAVLPVGFGLIVASVRRARAGSDARRRFALFGNEGSRALLLGLLALIGLAGLMLSYSRAGTAVAVAAVGATLAVTAGGPALRRAALVAAIFAVAAIPLADVGIDRLWGRYADASGDVTVEGGRLDVWRDTLGLIRHVPLVGCGLGAYTWAFPAVSSPTVRLHYTHAHDDLLQLAAEGGAIAVALLVLIAAPLFRRGARIVAERSSPIAVGAVAGLAAMCLHALVDFDFHIPADAAIAAVLAGIVLGATWTDPS
ncbi:MAG TPA: O-antigen ligase family protein [Candidatus Polarisedimenticolaceae bacterium]|nr:O-antigen ligase family protein [Candidatus Polarisedimenticolaceae bacterium]